MLEKLTIKYKLIFLIILIPVFFITNSITSEAKTKSKSASGKVVKSKKTKKSKKSKKSKRVYNVKVNRENALQTIQSSQELSNLAGLEIVEAIKTENTQQNIVENQEPVYEEGEDIAELEREDDKLVDLDLFKNLWMNFTDDNNGNTSETASGIGKSQLMSAILNWLGTPYRFGGTSDNAIDCSAFVLTIYREVGDINLPRTAREQFKIGTAVNRSELQFGDLIFFHTRRHAFISHVGIYLGDNLFAHASSRYGVTVSSLESTYYNNRFIGAKRLTSMDVPKFSRG